MASLKDILNGYRVIVDNGKVQRTEVVDPEKGQIADGAQPVLGWDRYLGETAPDDVVQQVKDVRAKVLAASGVTLPPYKPATNAIFIRQRCKQDRCFMFAEGG